MSFGGTSQKCHVCHKTAYEMEAMTYDKMTFHKTCFKCLNCKREVPLKEVAMIASDLYCKPCFMKKFKEKGQYSSFGEKTLPKNQQGDAAAHKDAPAAAASPAKEAPAKETPKTDAAAAPAAVKPARPASTSVTMPGAGNRIQCYKCTKVVYEMELITYDKMNFHKNCFRCLKCNNVTGLGQVAMIAGDLYCKPCFMKTFKEKGKYSSFGEKTLPKNQQGKADAAPAAAPAKADAPAAAAAPAATPAAEAPKTDAPAAAAPAAEAPKADAPAAAAPAEPAKTEAPAAEKPAEAAPAAAAPAAEAPKEAEKAPEAAPAAAAPAAEAPKEPAAPAEAAPAAAAAPAEAAPAAAAAPAEAAPAAAPAEAAPAAAPAEAAPAAAPAEAAPAPSS